MNGQRIEAEVGPAAVPATRTPGDWARLMRVPHWLKSAIVFPAVVLIGQGKDAGTWVQAGWAFAAFCLASSAVYIVNDWFDREADRLHPAKRDRPLVTGLFAPGVALWTALLLALASLWLGWSNSPTISLCVAAYLVLNLLYDVALKYVPIADAVCVAGGFVLRVAACWTDGVARGRGTWLLLSTFLLCVFLVGAKRTTDLQACMAGPTGEGGVRGAEVYTLPALRYLLGVAGVLAVGAYGVFAWIAAGSGLMALLTVLPVVYSMVRFARLSQSGAFRDHLGLVRSDWQLMSAVLAWLALWVFTTA